MKMEIKHFDDHPVEVIVNGKSVVLPVSRPRMKIVESGPPDSAFFVKLPPIEVQQEIKGILMKGESVPNKGFQKKGSITEKGSPKPEKKEYGPKPPKK